MWLTVRGSNGGAVSTHRLDEGAVLTIGRDSSCHIVIDDESVAPVHARMTGLPGARVGVEDLSSASGTWIDGTRLTGPTAVEAGRALRIGRHTIGLSISAPASSGPPGPPAGFVVQPAAPTEPPLAARPTPIPPPPPAWPPPPASPPPATPPGFPAGAGTRPSPPGSAGWGPGAVLPPGPAGLPSGPVGLPPGSGSPTPPSAAPPPPPPRPDAPPRALPRWVGAPPVTPVAPPPPGAAPEGDTGVRRFDAPRTGAAGPQVPAPYSGPSPSYYPTPGAPPAFTPPGSGMVSPFGPSALPRRRRVWLWIALAVIVVLLIAGGVVAAANPFSTASTYTPNQLYKRWGPSTLYIQTDVDGKPLESGSAWVLNAAAGLVVTNAHVVEFGPPTLSGLGDAATTYSVGQGGAKQAATLVGVAPCEDLAVLKIWRTTGLRSFVLGHQHNVSDGDAVTALGYPGAGNTLPSLTLTTGVVSVGRTSFTQASLDTPEYPDLIQTNAPIDPGSSGGPLLDSKGQLIGINTASITEENDRAIQGEYFAIGIDRARPVLRSLAAGQSLAYTGFGFVFPQSAENFEAFGLPEVTGGIIVPTAQVGSPAYDAGFGRGQAEVITKINGQALNGTLPSYCKVVSSYKAGQSAEFTVEKADGAVSQVKVGFA